MHQAIRSCLKAGIIVFALSLGAACVAVSITPPLSSNGTNPEALYHGVAFTSGSFKRPHQTMGVVQMTQQGFRNYLFGEVNTEGTQRAQIMKALAQYIADRGADGIQSFSLVEENPRSEEERTAQQVGQSIKIAAAIAEKNPDGAGALGEGETTTFVVTGELVKWTEGNPDPTIEALEPADTLEDLTQ